MRAHATARSYIGTDAAGRGPGSTPGLGRHHVSQMFSRVRGPSCTGPREFGSPVRDCGRVGAADRASTRYHRHPRVAALACVQGATCAVAALLWFPWRAPKPSVNDKIDSCGGAMAFAQKAPVVGRWPRPGSCRPDEGGRQPVWWYHAPTTTREDPRPL